MAATPSIDMSGWLTEQLSEASPDLLRAMLSTFVEALMGAEADAVCGAPFGERSPERVNVRNGYRLRPWDTRAGSIELAIPKLRAIAAELPEGLTVVPLIAAGLGLRPGEVYGLAVEHIDFLRRSVAVTQQLAGARKPAPLKTAASYRTVSLPRVIGEALSAYIARTGRASGLLFAEADGRPVRLSEANAAWRRASRKAGAEGLRLHDCRHAYASALIAAGESVKTIQARLGHASAMVTLDVYGHLWPDSEEQTRAAVDAWLDPPADCVRTRIVSARVSGS